MQMSTKNNFYKSGLKTSLTGLPPIFFLFLPFQYQYMGWFIINLRHASVATAAFLGEINYFKLNKLLKVQTTQTPHGMCLQKNNKILAKRQLLGSRRRSPSRAFHFLFHFSKSWRCATPCIIFVFENRKHLKKTAKCFRERFASNFEASLTRKIWIS